MEKIDELTKNTFESVPLWGIKSTRVLTSDLDKGRCEPEHIVVVFFIVVFPSKALAHQSWSKTSPSGQTKVRLKDTGGAGSISDFYEILCL